jgi:5-methylcytosine-specific restriction endonuclease McrA
VRHQCQRCRRSGLTLQVHHKTYERLGHESPADLEVLCTDCHRTADQERREQAQRLRAFAWAARVHGQYWRDTLDEDDVVDEFEDWLERRA